MRIVTQLQKLFAKQPRIIVIAGQTSVGKTTLAVELARAVNGEIISADSRQIYKGLNLASGKVTREEMRGIPHHMLDLITPLENYSVAEYVRDGKLVIDDILSRGKVPIICGGTGFYIDALVSGSSFNDVPPNEPLRKQLEPETTDMLYSLLETRAPKRALEIGPDNKQRIIRALEIFETLGKIPKRRRNHRYQTLWICATRDRTEIHSRIKQRIYDRLDKGMTSEIETLLTIGVTHERLESLGLECRYISRYIQGNIDLETMVRELTHKTNQFSKRQHTWFKRNKQYHRLHPEREKDYIIKLSRTFLK